MSTHDYLIKCCFGSLSHLKKPTLNINKTVLYTNRNVVYLYIGHNARFPELNKPTIPIDK